MRPKGALKREKGVAGRFWHPLEAESQDLGPEKQKQFSSYAGKKGTKKLDYQREKVSKTTILRDFRTASAPRTN